VETGEVNFCIKCYKTAENLQSVNGYPGEWILEYLCSPTPDPIAIATWIDFTIFLPLGGYF
jgi:hypothetical protein